MITVKFENEKYQLTQDAYIAGTNEQPYYTAAATLIGGDPNDSYRVVWGIIEGAEDAEDESECCDWANPANVERD